MAPCGCTHVDSCVSHNGNITKVSSKGHELLTETYPRGTPTALFSLGSSHTLPSCILGTFLVNITKINMYFLVKTKCVPFPLDVN